jgi:V/A-type H+-transporting ATPase subunit C
VDGILEALKVLPCGRVLDEVAIKYIEHGSISVFERALEEALFRRAQVAGRHDGLGFGMTLAFLWAKANEVTNLRIIVKGLTVGMPPERMREELIHA